jgi:hypothetical protein
MMRTKTPLLRTACAAFFVAVLSGCVATQKVPVSTDPSGAFVFLDGKQVCEATPCSVEIPKDQDHLLTILKDGYRQKDIAVRRVFNTASVLRESVREGARSGVEGALSSADQQERDGRAYTLKPDMVMLKLVGVNEPEPAPAARGAQGTGDPMLDMGLEFFRIIEGGKGDQAQ